MMRGRRAGWWRVSPGSAEAYIVAAVLVLVACLVRWGLGFLTLLPKLQLQTFTTFYPAVLIATLVGGAGPGIFVIISGGIICWWFFLFPYSQLVPLSLANTINLVSYVVVSAAIVWATDHYRKLTKRLRDEENLRKLAVDELAHRLKNKVATIQSIVRLRLRDYPQIGDEVIGSLSALMAVDDLIIAAQGKGANLRDILAAEFGPYDPSRVSTRGPDCLLSSKLALTMALVVHELTTNAAKYGAFSIPAGKLSIDWSVSDTRLNLTWRESGGPTVSPPEREGFGTQLFQRALAQFDGKVEADFAPPGLICTVNVRLDD